MAFVKTVEIYSCNFRIFKILQCFSADDGCHNGCLYRSKALQLSLTDAFLSPELVIFLFETVKNICHRCRPVYLIGIREDESEHILRSKAIGSKEIGIIKSPAHLRRVNHHLGADLLCKPLTGADGPGNGHLLRSLPAIGQHSGHIDTWRLGRNHIASGFKLPCRTNPSESPVQTSRP